MKEMSEIYKGNHEFNDKEFVDESDLARKLTEKISRKSTLGKSVHTKNARSPKYVDPNTGKEL